MHKISTVITADGQTDLKGLKLVKNIRGDGKVARHNALRTAHISKVAQHLPCLPYSD